MAQLLLILGLGAWEMQGGAAGQARRLNSTFRHVAAVCPQFYTRQMTRPRLLSEQEFAACFVAPMQDVTAEAASAVDIWSYVDHLDPGILGIATIGDVHCIYRDAHDRFDQILIDVGRSNTFLVVVVDRKLPALIGHHLLDLNEKYKL